MTPELIESAVTLATACGVGGIWYRLGVALRGHEEHDKKLTRMDDRVRNLEKHIWRGA